MGRIYGYCRVSSKKQNIERQVRNILAVYPTAIIEALNQYTIALAKQQVRIKFEQSEKEVMDLRQRTKEGIETSRLNGSQIGHPVGTKLVVKKAVNVKKLIKQHSKDFDGTLDDMMCMKIAEVSRNSFYKYKKN